MKGVVEKLYDIDSIEIPEELLECQADEKNVEAAVRALSLRYAREENADLVSRGDLAVCRADKESYPDGRTILIYTGVNMPGAEAAEAAVMGKHAGEVVSTVLCGKEAALTIEKILHRIPAEVTDELIAGIGMEGVSTVQGYRDHVRARMEEDLRMEKSKEIIQYFLQKMTQESTYQYDEAELEAYVQSQMEEYIREAEEAGETVSPEEIKESVLAQAKQNWMAEAFCKAKNVEVDLSSIEEDTDRMIEMMELMGEKVPDRAELSEMAVQDAYFGGLLTSIENIIREKTGGSYGNC